MKSQVSLEYSMTYGLVILIIIIAGVALYTSGVFSSKSIISKEYNGLSGFTVLDWKADTIYKKEIRINNTGNENLTNHQVPINITYNSHMKPDFSNIRFKDVNGNIIPYWIEKKINSKWAKIWVKVPYISANSTTSIFLYYGSPYINSKSSLASVFGQKLVGFWLFDEGKGNVTHDYSGNGNDGVYYSSGVQENSTLLELNSTVNGTHVVKINDVNNEQLTSSAFLLFDYSVANNNTNISIYINNHLQKSLTVDSGNGSKRIEVSLGYLNPNSNNNITYVVNDTTNITHSRLGYNFVSEEAKHCLNNVCEDSWVKGKYGKALSFDGVDDYVNCGNDKSMSVTSAFTIIGWVILNDYNGNPNLISKREGNLYEPYRLEFTSSSIILWLASDPSTRGTAALGNPLPLNQYKMVTVSFKNGLAKFYYDNVYMGSSTSTIKSAYISTGDVYIGQRGKGYNWWKGIINKILIYNRSLTDEEIKNMYANPEPTTNVGTEKVSKLFIVKITPRGYTISNVKVNATYNGKNIECTSPSVMDPNKEYEVKCNLSDSSSLKPENSYSLKLSISYTNTMTGMSHTETGTFSGKVTWKVF